jgi:hypothetical protein
MFHDGHMRISASAQADAMDTAESGARQPVRGIEFDDRDWSPEQKQLEMTKQQIWEKLLARMDFFRT